MDLAVIIRELTAKNVALVSENKRLRDHITSLTIRSSESNYRIPNEILGTVLTYALPPAFLLDPNSSFSPSSAWLIALRTKKALTLVCRAWNPVATEILYEEVNIRRLAQMTLLITLFQSRPDLGSMVKRLILSCFVPEDGVDDFNKDLLLLHDLCPRVISLCPSTLTWAEHTKAASIPPILHSLTRFSDILELTLDTGVFASDLLQILRHAEKVKSLSFRLRTEDEKEELPLTHSCLKSLVWGFAEPDYRSVPALLPSLSLPELTHLTIDWRDTRNSNYTADDFVRRNARNLVYLNLNYSTSFNADLFNKLIEESPSLRHIVLNDWPEKSLRRLSLIHHPNIKYLDVWVRLPETTQVDLSLDLSRLIQSSRLPRLENIRRLDYALITLLRLPLDLPPEEHNLYKDRPSRFMFPGIDVEVGENFVWKNDMEYLAGYGERIGGPFADRMGGRYRPLRQANRSRCSHDNDSDCCQGQGSTDWETRSEDSSDTEDSFTDQSSLN